MRKILGIAAVTAFLLSACGEKKVEKLSVIAVEVIQPSDSTVVLSKRQTAEEIAAQEEPKRIELKIDTANKVYFQEGLTQGVYSITNGKNRTEVYFIPQNVISVQFTGEANQPVLFNEDLRKINNLYDSLKFGIYGMYRGAYPYYAGTETAFMNWLDSTDRMLDSTLVNFITNKPSYDKNFYEEMQANLYNASMNQLVRYASKRDMYAENDLPALSADYMARLNSIDLNNVNALDNAYYQLLLEDYLDYAIDQAMGDDPKEYMGSDSAYSALTLHVIDSVFPTKEVRDFVLAGVIGQEMDFMGYKIGDQMKKAVMTISDTAVQEGLNNKVAIWKPLMPGQPAIDFTYPDTAGNMISLSDFKGKYVYVDVWATWCGPCMREVPFLKELEEEFKNDNIVFLGVSVDNDEAAWRKKMSSGSIVGTQIWAGGWKGLTDDYMIKGIPRFMLFDTEGNIVDVLAERPSGKIKEQLEELLR